ncbi:hypothetical protein M434DRAFT_7784 [Hypoxylon sp. CO27-5]|nr:hypothetical protein M434DRAFT_7784 [Hypoxylon sp. CO27-5]
MPVGKQRKLDPIPESEFTGVRYSWRDQHMKEFDKEAAACAAAVGARGKKKMVTTNATASSTEKHESPPTTDPLIVTPSPYCTNDQPTRVSLRLDWSLSFDPPLIPGNPGALSYANGTTVFHSPYFATKRGAAAWTDSAEWPWSEGERRQWFKWREEPEKEDEDDGTASSTHSSSPAALSRGQRPEKEAKKGQDEEDTKHVPVQVQAQAAHHRQPGLSYRDVLRRS